MIDGYILSKLERMPITLMPEIGVQIRFHEFFKKLTGRDLIYPNVKFISKNLFQYLISFFVSLKGHQNTVHQSMFQEVDNINNTRNDSNNNNIQSPIRRTVPRTRYVLDPDKLEVPYPAPLPNFSPLVKHYLQTSKKI